MAVGKAKHKRATAKCYFETLRQTLNGWQMREPTLLFLASHQPLAFVAGHVLLALAPLGGLLGWTGLTPVAAILVEPDAAAQIEAMLAGDLSAFPTRSRMTRSLAADRQSEREVSCE